MFSPFALILIPLGYTFMTPLAARLLGDKSSGDSRLLIPLTGVIFSMGTLALALFWAGMIPGPTITPAFTLGVLAAGLGLGWWLNRGWFNLKAGLAGWRAIWAGWRALDFNSLLMWAIFGVGAVVLIADLYYPFIGDDTLSRYGLQAQLIYHAHDFPVTITGYPPLAPLTFVWTWFAAGAPIEQLARLFPFVAGMGAVGATYLIGREAGGKRVGLLAAGCYALTPMFVFNSTFAYTDIPTAFPLLLGTYFMLRWWANPRLREALLAGAMLGIALFVKQSALIWIPSLCLIPVIKAWGEADLTLAHRVPMAAETVAVIGLTSLLIGGPWYIRNVLIDGPLGVLPLPGLFHVLQSGAGILGAVPPLYRVSSTVGWGLVIPLTVGWVVGILRAIMEGISSLRRRPGGTPFFLLTGVAFLPYWLAWWTQFSFDARFTLIFMPLVGVWAALILHDLSGRIEGRISVPAWFSRLLTILTLVPLFLLATHSRWGGVYRALTQPLASYDARVAEVNSRSYELSQWVIHNLDPAETRIAVMDGKMLYYLIGYDVTQMYPLNLDSLEEFDYLIHSSSLFAVYGPTLGWETSEFYQHIWDPMIFEPVFVSDGVNIMRVLRTTLPTPEERQQFNEPASEGGDQ